MLFQVQLSNWGFICFLEGKGKIKVRIDDGQEKIVSLPGKISIDKLDSEIRKIQISNINAKNIKIGPVVEGHIAQIESWGDLDIISLESIFLRNKNREIIVPDHIPKSLKRLSRLLYHSRISRIKGM